MNPANCEYTQNPPSVILIETQHGICMHTFEGDLQHFNQGTGI